MRVRKASSLLVLSVFLCLFAAGCFDTPTEVILVSDAVKISGLPQKYLTYTITPVPGSNDYRYHKPAADGAPEVSGYARAILLKDDIYVAQFRDDNQQGYTIEFFKLVNNAGVAELKVALPETFPNPEDYGVKWEMDDFGMETVAGPRESIMAYIRAHAGLNFTVSQQPG